MPALPNPRLNPLLNPLLAKQLGRWAHIYYTASVDKREAAIEQLVCELEAEEARLGGEGSTSSARELSVPTASRPRIASPVLVSVEPGDVIPREPLSYEASQSLGVGPHAEEVRFDPPPQFDLPQFDQRLGRSEPENLSASSLPPQAEREESAGQVAVPESWQELLRRTDSAPPEDRWRAQDVREAERIPEPRSGEGTYVSRDAVAYSQSFDDLLAKSEQIQMHQPPSQSWRRPAIISVTLILLCGSLWMYQSRRFWPGTVEPDRKPVAPAAQRTAVPSAVAPRPTSAIARPDAVPSGTSAALPQTSAAAPTTAPTETHTPPNVAGASSVVGAPGSMSSRSIPATALPVEATPPPDPDFVAGMSELQGPQRNSADAARHLWQSVKNQNSGALIPLAQLYAKGDGVTKDCDQAKVLLDAATRQAKSRPQFLRAEMSRASLRTAGCE